MVAVLVVLALFVKVLEQFGLFEPVVLLEGTAAPAPAALGLAQPGGTGLQVCVRVCVCIPPETSCPTGLAWPCCRCAGVERMCASGTGVCGMGVCTCGTCILLGQGVRVLCVCARVCTGQGGGAVPCPVPARTGGKGPSWGRGCLLLWGGSRGKPRHCRRLRGRAEGRTQASRHWGGGAASQRAEPPPLCAMAQPRASPRAHCTDGESEACKRHLCPSSPHGGHCWGEERSLPGCVLGPCLLQQ